MVKVETTEMTLLEQRLADSNKQLCFLIDFVSLSPTDMELNKQTIRWLQRMPSIFNEHQKIVTDKTEQYQRSLKVSSSTFSINLILLIYLCCEWSGYFSTRTVKQFKLLLWT